MQIHLSRQLLIAWRTLPPTARRFVEALQSDPRPAGAMRIPERPNYYEEFIEGVWIGWTVDDRTGETVVIVGIVEESI